MKDAKTIKNGNHRTALSVTSILWLAVNYIYYSFQSVFIYFLILTNETLLPLKFFGIKLLLHFSHLQTYIVIGTNGNLHIGQYGFPLLSKYIEYINFNTVLSSLDVFPNNLLYTRR